ncbi:alanine--tRNA ligase, partial [bacterium]
MDTDTLRQKYLNFFARKGHKIIPSSSLVPVDDPTVLFTSAGMAQFKKEFLGQVTGVRRATSCQRCLRTDDLEKVGVTSAHHTFFEMLGNFSFGDYFKEEAIAFAWEFLLRELEINPDVLWVSVYQDDEEAYGIWSKKIKFPENRIVRLGAKENFWPANAIEDGPNGPCGPCSEIFFDYGKDTGCKRHECDPGCNCGRFVEIWNLVFTQFNRKDKGVLEPLPNKNIDTGMGLERMASVLQGVKTNFEIDIFKPIINEIISYAGRSSRNQLLYAIADHIRAVTFAIYDGVMPSNEQRGYVVRKLIRKAEFHGYTVGIKEPFLYKLAPVVAEVFVKAYPDLRSSIGQIAAVINDEEKLFMATIMDAPRILEDEFKALDSSGGHIAFKLYDTYGIPLEITKSWAQEKGIKINEEEFREDLRRQKERSKKASKISEGIFVSSGLDLGIKESRFLGYRGLSVESAKILKIIKDSKMVKQALAGESCQIILDKTPFYGESGGQIGDRGRIVKGKSLFSVEDTLKQDRVIIHCGRQDSGKLKVGDSVNCAVDREFRQAVARAHTATHLLQWALREVLGTGIRQAGSLVEQDRLRFDFIYTQRVSEQ